MNCSCLLSSHSINFFPFHSFFSFFLSSIVHIQIINVKHFSILKFQLCILGWMFVTKWKKKHILQIRTGSFKGWYLKNLISSKMQSTVLTLYPLDWDLILGIIAIWRQLWLCERVLWKRKWIKISFHCYY